MPRRLLVCCRPATGNDPEETSKKLAIERIESEFRIISSFAWKAIRSTVASATRLQAL
jgi:hypothetical protein|tara:strand:- start:47 stop:220 length:174 start_codon:yes stop_codon:yes gene_type:complete